MGPLEAPPYRPQTALNPDRLFMLHHIGFDKRITRAEGSYVFDEQGTAYLDALAQYGALPFGHNPPVIWEALQRVRRESQPSFTQPLLNAASEELARELVSVLPGMAHVTFVNSGAEATEGAIKLARARTGRRRIVSVERGFHGKTHAALCATANPRYRAPFLIEDPQFSVVAFGDLAALGVLLEKEDVAAFIVEPVQGEGGMRPQPAGYLQAAGALCRRHGTLPTAFRFGAQNVLGYPTGLNLACLCETLVLALEGSDRHCSIGNRIDYREALHVFRMARKHGFRLHLGGAASAGVEEP